MGRNYFVALLWVAALVGGTAYLARPYWGLDAFAWGAWVHTFAWPIALAAILFACMLDTPWRRRLEERYYRWKFERNCSPEELRTIREDRANAELRERLEKRKKQTQAELMALKSRRQEQIKRDVWKRQQLHYWKGDQGGPR